MKAAAQFSRYVLVGSLSAGVDVASFWLLLGSGIWRAAALGIALVAGMAVNYLLHQSFTFRSRAATGARSIALYLIVVGLNYLLTLLLVEIGVQLGLHIVTSKLLSLPIIALTGFLFMRRFVF